MRKAAIVTSISIIIAFFLGTPYFFGQTNQSLNDELLTRANHMLQGKGEPLPVAQQDVVASFVIDEKIYHGPFYWGKDAGGKSHFGFGRGYFVSMISPNEQTRQWLQAQGLRSQSNNWEERSAEISLLGRIRATSYISALNFKNSDTTLNWQGAKTKMTLSPGLNNLKANVTIGALSYDQKQSRLEIPSANVNVKLRYKTGLWVGSSELKVPQITTNRNDKAELTLNNFLLQGNSNVSGNLLSTTVTLAADSMQMGAVDYGPFSYNLNMQNVDATAWLKLKDLASQYDTLMNANSLQYNLNLTQYHRGWFRSNAQIVLTISRPKPTGLIQGQLHNLSRQSELLILGNEISKTLPAVVNKGAQFSLQPTPGHAQPSMLQIDASLTFPKVLQAEDIGQLIEKAEAHINVLFLADLIKMATEHQYPEKTSADVNATTEALLNKWVASGYLSRSDAQYLFSLDYSQGKLSLNGKTMADTAAEVVSDSVVSGVVAPAAGAVPITPAGK
ncbi:MAG: hypothetical protein K0R48_271 [Gammaproteobacteria bacterium]|nr:hypothetical protein [Gammaproteobacteria bacterium]